MTQKKIAIACQGGGSQTAFTAGVLKTFLENDVQEKTQIVALSGTSGGAICAALTWFSLKKDSKNDATQAARRLTDFWQDNATQYLFEDMTNDMMVGALRLAERGLLPQISASPSHPFAQFVWPAMVALLPHQNFYNLEKLLKTHIDFDEIATWDKNNGPALLIGAADVLSGDFKKFSSRLGEITANALLASAAVPTLFPAVSVDDNAYWDGQYSDNPPTDELLDEKLVGKGNQPDELWVIRINPITRESVPVSPGDISDRRNEMIGNQSLEQDLQKIKLINRLLAAGAFTPEYRKKYQPVEIRSIEMSVPLQKELDYATKLDRNRDFIKMLMRDGENQGRIFLRELGLAPS